MDWEAYFAAVADQPPHEVYDLAAPYFPPAGHALDLGAGTGRGAAFLRGRGLTVTAVDNQPTALATLRGRFRDDPGVEVVDASLAEFVPPPCDVVAAAFSLFFLPPDEFDAAWARVRAALRPGGVFLGQFLGPRDSWAPRGYATHDAEAVRALLAGGEVRHWEEVERPGRTATGNDKHWHVFHVVWTHGVGPG